jgi:hypothetical protein
MSMKNINSVFRKNTRPSSMADSGVSPRSPPDIPFLLLFTRFVAILSNKTGGDRPSKARKQRRNMAHVKRSSSYAPSLPKKAISYQSNDSKSRNWANRSHFVIDYNAPINTLLTISPRPRIYVILSTPAFSGVSSNRPIQSIGQSHAGQRKRVLCDRSIMRWR